MNRNQFITIITKIQTFRNESYPWSLSAICRTLQWSSRKYYARTEIHNLFTPISRHPCLQCLLVWQTNAKRLITWEISSILRFIITTIISNYRFNRKQSVRIMPYRKKKKRENSIQITKNKSVSEYYCYFYTRYVRFPVFSIFMVARSKSQIEFWKIESEIISLKYKQRTLLMNGRKGRENRSVSKKPRYFCIRRDKSTRTESFERNLFNC